MPNLDAMASNRFEIYYLHDVEDGLVRLNEDMCRAIYKSEQISKQPLGDHIIGKNYYHKDQSISDPTWMEPDMYDLIYPPTEEEKKLVQTPTKNYQKHKTPVKVCNQPHNNLPDVDYYDHKLVQSFCKAYRETNGKLPDESELRGLLWTNFGVERDNYTFIP